MIAFLHLILLVAVFGFAAYLICQIPMESPWRELVKGLLIVGMVIWAILKVLPALIALL